MVQGYGSLDTAAVPVDFSALRGLRDCVRAGPGIRWDFGRGRAELGRRWHQKAPPAVAAELCRDVTAEELAACREASRIDKVPAAPSSQRPMALCIVGPSGAGKSMVTPKAAAIFGLDLSTFAEVDGDVMRGCHEAWKTRVVGDTQNGYFDAYDIYITNKKNKGLKVQFLRELVQARKNVIYPDTHVKEDDLALMKEQGYIIYTLALLISCAESDCRQRNRAETNGRWSSTPEKKWLVTMGDVLKMCEPGNSDQALAFDSTDVLNPSLVYARGVSGMDPLDNIRETFDKLKADSFWKAPRSTDGHTWCECLSLVGTYQRQDGVDVQIRVSDPCSEVSQLNFDPPVDGFVCLFSVKTCTLHLPGDKPGKVGSEVARFEVVTQTIRWAASSPFSDDLWVLKGKLPGSIARAVREDAELLAALGGALDFCRQPFRALTAQEWSEALEACGVTGPKAAPPQTSPKALLVMAPSAGGKTTVVSKFASSYSLSADAAVHADGAIFRDFHAQYSRLCENGAANEALWFNAWPAAKSVVQSAKKEVLRKAFETKQNLLVSDTGAEADSLKELVSKLKAAGYEVLLLGIYADPRAILSRGIAREIKDGKRYNRSIEKLRATFDNFGAAIEMVDGAFKIVHNPQGGEPTATLEGQGGSLTPTLAEELKALVRSI